MEVVGGGEDRGEVTWLTRVSEVDGKDGDVEDKDPEKKPEDEPKVEDVKEKEVTGEGGVKDLVPKGSAAVEVREIEEARVYMVKRRQLLVDFEGWLEEGMSREVADELWQMRLDTMGRELELERGRIRRLEIEDGSNNDEDASGVEEKAVGNEEKERDDKVVVAAEKMKPKNKVQEASGAEEMVAEGIESGNGKDDDEDEDGGSMVPLVDSSEETEERKEVKRAMWADMESSEEEEKEVDLEKLVNESVVEGCWKKKETRWARRKRMQAAKGKSKSPSSGAAVGLGILGVVEPVRMNVVGDGEWEELELTVDSGAAETVVGAGQLECVRTVEGEARGMGSSICGGGRDEDCEFWGETVCCGDGEGAQEGHCGAGVRGDKAAVEHVEVG